MDDRYLSPQPPDLNVGIVGAGRVACALAHGLAAAGLGVTAVASRGGATAHDLAAAVGARACSAVEALRDVDLLLLAVPDDALPGLAAALAAGAADAAPGARRPAVVHCSGAVSVGALAPLAQAGHAVGALHLLQAFPTRSTPVRAGIAAAITAQPPLRQALVALARRLGAAPLLLADEDRARYHVAAVLASNLQVTLLAHAADLLGPCGLTRAAALDVLLELSRSALDGLAAVGLPDGLTGPLVRGDVGTIAAHLAVLDGAGGGDPAPTATADLYRAGSLATLPLLAERGVPAVTLAALTAALGGRQPPEAPVG